jgi:glycine/D-amino acid oxidase-like deaminating enzyme
MNLVSGYPFWLIKDGLPFNYPALKKSISTDVLIIGAGISGALAAWHLLNAGVKCVVIDSRTIGLGSTCASTSLLQYEIDEPLSDLIDKVGERNAVLSYKLCEEAIHKIGEIDKKIKCGEFESKKSLYYAAGKKDTRFLNREYETRKMKDH